MTAALTLKWVGHSPSLRFQASNPKLPALMLIAHQDVVPVPGTEDAWTHDPLVDIDDTHVWGRGALDIKDMLMASLRHLSICSQVSAKTIIYLAFGEDEEVFGSSTPLGLQRLWPAMRSLP